ncbi:MAG: hypothetical protein A3E07_00650 [Candidatus Wildermuthbacteria bacterium RIFCSPHIGHO2_12_FULL_45_9]|uniref:Uncharacterized protein n=1 Tax=Candidatus Wildermuthbacteria bacterium RIFCSPHIGHO2_02_FULL_45_25 TaxID=1802450 RepID=A0A1G2R256_9BACT|nr:MAG: hypothetical protein A2748_00435 [Candidatus Wildermuthbacteria bacterium RIFCSPHIGHO2_01_FULL_45_20]OHA66668.1 MAG: hypothetical protein A3C04_00580 [Candidatus Wildermuthbacteria bacterium RIFCSPHIGHO2_02_FULL_45_25]OHA70299.1 MAG: hypothetical protein A3E07_00650 [Candidatus Wildermuthbacteria bacterium RIFCSPHIGHO2_12_FULL_45_9]
MEKIDSHLKAFHTYVVGRIPKLSILIPMFISIELGLSMLVGYFAARMCAGPSPKTRGRIPSLIFRTRTHKVHLHHWFVFSNILIVTMVLHVFIATPNIFYGFLGGIIAQGVLYYDDWHHLVSKHNS